MAWLGRPEKNKKYPKYAEVNYDPRKTETTIDVKEGRFYKIDRGYVLLAVFNSMTDIKPEANIPDTAISFELFGREYERFVNSENPSVKTQPSQMQVALCSYLDVAFDIGSELSDTAATLSKSSFSGTFIYTSSEMVAQFLNGNAETVEQYFFKKIKPVDSAVLPESIHSATGGDGKKGGFSGGEQRLNFLHKALLPYAPKPDDFTPTVACFASVLVGMALAKPGSFERTTYEELHWLLPLLFNNSRQ